MERPPLLVVSEDAEFATSCYEQMRRHGLRTIACLGSAHGPCLMAPRGTCPLAEAATAVIVNAPGGAFGRGTRQIPAGDYATDLQRRHPRPWVLMTAGPEGATGRTGEATVVDRDWAVGLLALLLVRDPAERRQ